MELAEAIRFLQPAISPQKGNWADIGAGTGTFTRALDQLLEEGSTIYAVDTNPNPLRHIQLTNCQLQVRQHDFNQAFDLPRIDGVIMANALHYSANPIATLKNVLEILQPGGHLVLIEYELDQPRKPWIPYPIIFEKFKELATELPLTVPVELARIPSTYGNNYMYLAKSQKIG